MGRSGVIFSLVLAGLAGLVWAAHRTAALQYCKPVVPQVAIKIDPSGPQPRDLLIRYDEAGSPPDRREAFSNSNTRSSFCETRGDTCIASRARYELRFEGDRAQSIQIRGMGNGQGNPLMGAVQWSGPSYPERIDLDCDFSQTDLRRACRISRLVYDPNPMTSGYNGGKPRSTRHDQCTPAKGAQWLIGG